MKATWNGVIIATSDDTVVVEGNHYFPADSVDSTLLSHSAHTSYCPWKGTANYFSVTADGKTIDDAAWYYAEPKSKASHIKGRIAFWNGVEISD